MINDEISYSSMITILIDDPNNITISINTIITIIIISIIVIIIIMRGGRASSPTPSPAAPRRAPARGARITLYYITYLPYSTPL